jgi:hypothetical protein
MTNGGLFKKVDCYMLFVPNLEDGINFYENELGHTLIWRRETAAGLKMPDTDTEIVLNTNLPQESDLLVDSVKDAFKVLISKGCKPIQAPFEIAVGWCAVVLDPFGNMLTFLDLTKIKQGS